MLFFSGKVVNLNKTKLFLQPADVEVGRLVDEAEKLRQLNHHDAPAIMRQVSAMEARWQRFLSRMEDHRAMLEASIEFHQLYEQVCFRYSPCFESFSSVDSLIIWGTTSRDVNRHL